MTLNQYDWGKRVPYSPNPDGYYYWSSTYYLDSADFGTIGQMTNWVFAFEKQITCNNVQQTWFTRKVPPGRANIVQTSYQFLQVGNRPIGTAGYSLLMICRWNIVSETGRKSYKYIRLPLRPIDMDGMMLAAPFYTNMQLTLNNFLIGGRFRNKYNERYTSGTVSPRIHMWQLRHGTDRRARPVIV